MQVPELSFVTFINVGQTIVHYDFLAPRYKYENNDGKKIIMYT